jgi:hypothetical protein
VLTAEQLLGLALADAGITCAGFCWLLPDREAEPGWFVVTRADGRRVRLDGVPPAQQAAASALVLAYDLTGATPDEDVAKRRFDAVVVLTVDELNVLRDWLTQFKAAVAAAGTLAALKTSVAALPALPERTFAQVRTAIRGKIDDNA